MSATNDLYDYGREHWDVTFSGVENDAAILTDIADILADAMGKIGPMLAKLDDPSTTTFDRNGYARSAPAFNRTVAAEIIVEAALDDYLTGPAQAVVIERLRQVEPSAFFKIACSIVSPSPVSL